MCHCQPIPTSIQRLGLIRVIFAVVDFGRKRTYWTIWWHTKTIVRIFAICAELDISDGLIYWPIWKYMHRFRKMKVITKVSSHHMAGWPNNLNRKSKIIVLSPLVLLQPSPRKEAKGRKAPKSPKKKKIKIEEPRHEYVEEDVQLVMEVTQQQEQRYPVIDPTRPFVCQKCGVSFAREKALLSHSKVKFFFVFLHRL